MRDRKTLMLVESALAVALALAVNKIGWEMPYGGSINFEMIPILFIGLRWGIGAGILAGTASGLLQLLISAHIYYPVQAIMDYPLAFAVLGLAGVVSHKMSGKYARIYATAGVLLGTLARAIMHILSGAIFFAEYAPEGQNVWLYTITYNLTYMLPSILICVVVMAAFLPQINKALDRGSIKSDKTV